MFPLTEELGKLVPSKTVLVSFGTENIRILSVGGGSNFVTSLFADLAGRMT